jgi:hypothetical protein
MRKKVKFLIGTSLVIGLTVLPITMAFATTTTSTATSGEIDVTVTHNDKAKDAVSGLTATISDSGNNDISSDVTVATISTGFKITGIPLTGAYYITLKDGANSETVKATVSSFKKATAVSALWDDASSLAKSKDGVLGGIALEADGKTPETGLDVEAYNANGTIWQTQTDASGAYELYLASGKYTVVVNGDSASNKNISTAVNVTAGEMTGPLNDDVQTPWASVAASELGYTKPTIASNLKTITGTANTGCTVAAYEYTAATGTSPASYAILAKPVVAKNNAYTLALECDPIGNVPIAIRVTDPALNVYEDDTVTVPDRSMTLTASTTATIYTSTVISYADSAEAAMTGNLTGSIYWATVTDANGKTVPLKLEDKAGNPAMFLQDSYAANSDYYVAGGKLTFRAGVLGIAQNYTITVSALGYNPCTIVQAVVLSTTPPGKISGTFTVNPGSKEGTTQFTTIGTAGTGNSLVYEVVPASTKSQYKGNVITGTPTALVQGTDICGVDPTTNKCIDIYEVTSNNVIVNYKRVTLSATNIKAPSILSAALTGSTLTITTDATLNTTAPAATAFTVKDGKNSVKVSSVSISGETAVLTLAKEITGGDTVTVAYTKPSSKQLKDADGNAIASMSALSVTNNNVAASALTATATKGSTKGSTVIAATPNTTGDSLVYVVSSTIVATPNVGDTVTGTSTLTSDNITGVNAKSKKYIAVYELDSNNKVVSFTLITLTSSDID